MSATSRGRGWEIGHSLWIIWSFSAFLGWISFFYIGIRAENKRWIIWGVFYVVPFALLLLVSGIGPSVEWPFNVILMAGIVQTIMCIVHSFLIRKEYLMRLDALKRQAAYPNVAQESVGAERFNTSQSSQSVHGERTYEKQPQEASRSVQNESPPANVASSSDLEGKVDLNRATEQTLAGLPGVGVILAKRAVSLRESQGGFQSIEEFGRSLNLRPHAVERLRPLVFVAPIRQGRDTNTSGRIVDF